MEPEAAAVTTDVLTEFTDASVDVLLLLQCTTCWTRIQSGLTFFMTRKAFFLSTKRRGCPMRLSLQQVPWKLIVSLLLVLLLMTSLIMMLVDAPSYPVNVSS